MSLVKITDAEKGRYGVTLLPNVPQIPAGELKEWFEQKSDELIIPKFNELSDQLTATGASELGAQLDGADTTIQGAINGLKDEVDLAVKHTDNTAVGSATQGVYVAADGTATAMTHSVNKDVPADAVFTDTTYTAGTGIVIDQDNKISATGSGGTTDYSLLSNKPKINSVELSGNKTTTDLGLPTTLAAMSDDSGHRTVSDTEKSTWNGKSTVSVTQVVSTGTKVATITVDGTGTDIYASGGGGGDVDDAYKSIKVGTTTITASGEDTFEIKAGSNVTLTPDAVNKSVTINASGGGQSTGDMLMSDYDSQANVKSAGGIEAYVATQAYQLPTAGSSTLGGVKINGNNLSIDANGVLSATDTTYTSKVESQGGQEYSLCTTGEKYTWNHKAEAFTTDSAPTQSSTNPVQSGGVYTALGDKQDSSTAVKHTASTAVGSATQGVYVASNGQATAMTYELNKTVPADAVFTDHTYESKTAAQGGTADSLCTTGEKYDWNNKVDSVTADTTGTASSSAVAYQRIGVADAGGSASYTEIAGTKYLETTSKSTSSGTDTFSFSHSDITTTALYDIYCDVFGVAPSDVVVTSGSMQVKFASTNSVTKVRVYIR